MDARFMIESPDDIVATMKITMKVKDWEALREQLQAKHPSSELSYNISSLLTQARRVIYPEPKPD